MTRVVCFGEMLLRLGATGHESLLRSGTLETSFGGAEANVALALAGLGLDASIVTVLPANPVGDACLGELRRHGVRIDGVRRVPGRMGLYFLTRGATLRPAQITYDRSGSAFALLNPRQYDWRALLAEAQWLHVSGITPALSAECEQAVQAALAMAAELNVRISFDCNYRPSLWQGREEHAQQSLRSIAQQAHVLFAGVRDAKALFDAETGDASGEDAFLATAGSAFAACERLEFVAGTERIVHGPGHHDLTGYLADRTGLSASRTQHLVDVIDRIGGGDAFAAGLIYGLELMNGQQGSLGRLRAVEFATALAALKHGVPGDFIATSADDVWHGLEADSHDVRR
jgi:2-dehydro-3-deoxygluconokinase